MRQLLTIDVFARAARLSPKALRLYDELGLLRPAAVDDPAQLERARLIAWLRRLGMPLARIRRVCDLPAQAAAEEIAGYWEQVLVETAARGQLAAFLVDYLTGRGSPVKERPRPHRLRGRRCGRAGNTSCRGCRPQQRHGTVSRSGVRSLGGYAVDRRPLAIAAYRRLWVASAVCAVGGSFSVVAIPTQLFTMTGSSATVGASAAVSFATLVAAALWTGALADVRDRRKVLLAAHCGLAVTYGAANFVLSTSRNAISQALTDDVMRGRIQRTVTVVLIGGPQIGNLLHGTAASIFGPRVVICAGRLLTAVTVAVIAWAVPELMQFTAGRP